MDKSPLCTCLMKQDLEEAADPYEFLDKNYSISGILDNLDKLSPKELKCACCLFGVALQKACRKKYGARHSKIKAAMFFLFYNINDIQNNLFPVCITILASAKEEQTK